MESVEEMDRLVAALPEWEGTPAPASLPPQEAAKLVARWEAESARMRREMEARLEAINRRERRTVWLILVVCFGLGLIPAVVAACRSGREQPAEFLRENP